MAFWKFWKRTQKKSPISSQKIDELIQDLDQLNPRRIQVEQGAKENNLAASRLVSKLQNTQDIKDATVNALDNQNRQIDTIDTDLNSMQITAKKTKYRLRNLSCCLGWCCNQYTSETPIDPSESAAITTTFERRRHEAATPFQGGVGATIRDTDNKLNQAEVIIDDLTEGALEINQALKQGRKKLKVTLKNADNLLTETRKNNKRGKKILTQNG